MRSAVARAALLATVAVLGACAQVRPVVDQAPGTAASRPAYGPVEYGVVSAIDRIGAEQQLSGTGALVGGVTGAVIGRQFAGSRDGRAVGTLVGAVAGALAGSLYEKQAYGLRESVRIVVQLDSGSQRAFDYAQAGDLRVGDRVRVEGGQILRM